MAKSNNSTGINADEIKKTKEYTEALDKLNSSLTNVNSALPKFSDGLEEGLKGIAEKLPEVISSMTKLNAQNKELAANGQKPASVLSQLGSSLFSWNNLLSIGVTLLVTYGGTLIKWVSDLMKGEAKLTALGKALKESAILTESLTQTKLKAAQTAQNEIADLSALYKASQDRNLSLQQQKEAVSALKQQWPDTFQGLKEDAILTGKAADAYKNLKDQIIAAAYAEAAKDKIAANAARDLENQQKIAKERKNNLEIVEKEKKAAKAIDDNKIKSTDDLFTAMGKGNAETIKYLYDKLSTQSRLRAASDKIINDLATDSKRLNVQNDAYYSEIEKRVDKFGATVLGYKKAIKSMPDPPKNSNNDLPETDNNEAKQELAASIAREAELKLHGYAKEIQAAENHFAQLKQKFKLNKATVEQLEKERVTTLATINQKYQDEELKKLDGYEQQLRKIGEEAGKTARQLALDQIDEKYKTEEKDLREAEEASKARLIRLEELLSTATEADKLSIQGQISKEKQEQNRITNITTGLGGQKEKEKAGINTDFDNKDAQGKIDETEQSGHHSKALQMQIALLNQQHQIAVDAARKKGEDTTKIEEGYAKKKAALEDQLTTSRIHAGDKFINAALKTGKKDSAIFKAAFLAKKATAIADTIISTKTAVMDSLKAYSGIPFIGQALGIVQAAFMAAQGASSIAEIAKQKPGFAAGGQFRSDGRGALLPGYSRTDNTNAYLRSGEAIVVSEAMRNPWARNLVSAINVAHGGRDFSIANPGRGYAIGGIFTDGGNSNRYYSQPMNEQKDLANTLAYQMINNFPPVYVDVKDINTQQSILARTVDRVNL